MSNNKYSDLTIILPTYNEKENLQKMMPELALKYPGATVIIADDGSEDGSGEYFHALSNSSFESPFIFIDRKQDKILTNMYASDFSSFHEDPLKIRAIKGLTASVIDSVYLTATPYFTVIDADFQHPIEIISSMREKLEKADLVCAFRTELGSFPLYRKIITWTGTFLANLVLPQHSRVKDPLSGAFAGRTEKLKKYFTKTENFRPAGFKVLFDLLKSISKDIRIEYHGYLFGARTAGESKIGFSQLLTFFKSIFDRDAKRAAWGFLLMSLVFIAAMTAIFIFGDVNISDSFRTFAKSNAYFMAFNKFVTDQGNPLYYLIVIYFLVKGILTKDKKYINLALTYIIVQLVACLVITGGLKIIVGRPRPGKGFVHHFFTNRSSFKSFPSGHTTDAFVSAGVFWMYFKSVPVILISFLFSTLIGLTRIFVGSHYPLDVLGGMLIGFSIAIIISYKRKRKEDTTD